MSEQNPFSVPDDPDADTRPGAGPAWRNDEETDGASASAGGAQVGQARGGGRLPWSPREHPWT